ncbi:lytic transglycosylase domain-containing protein [Thiomicrospira microaerophila]|uniref:lytic transglycosylase domain-containing protein n=1 Tax=Thiomicrospira microaerophila TaxID=406020 RepID=UPI00200D6C5A|nr:lytic transglycosylase domain-containing protein [Thiomicrospira microaerophila]UQB43295.1 lytic transglycosylase domain-containing protein [Thiomicrospira microaerophila]
MFKTIIKLKQLLILFVLVPTLGFAQTPQQQSFLAGIEYLKKSDRVNAQLVRTELENHPLLPVFIYQDIIRNLDRTPPSVILGFIKQYQHLAISDRLYQQWLTHLAQNKEWSDYLQHAKGIELASNDQQCWLYQAKINQQATDILITDLRNLWLDQIEPTDACKPLEDYLVKTNQLPGWLIWQKVERALTANQVNVARQLARYLSTEDRQAVNHWIEFHNQPEKLITELPSLSSAFINRKIFLHSLNRLANQQPETASQLLNLHQQRYNIKQDEQQTIQRTFSLRLAYRYDEKAHEFLYRYNQQSADQDTLRWQAQIALRQSDWSGLYQTINMMDPLEQRQSKWQYWMARALDQLQQAEKARPIFQQLAQERSYYGFLSADRLKQSYNLSSQPLSNPAQLQAVKQAYPALDLIENLLAIGWRVNATREWNHLLGQANEQDLTAIAQIAHQWQAYVFSFRALAQGRQWDQLELRFPTPYQQPVMQNAEKNQLDPAWIYSIIRRESAYQTDIRSSAGAVGLMQLRPSTARYIGQQRGLSRQTYQNLTDAQSNIQLGSAYLRYLLEKFDGHMVKATAAYNAGPRRVNDWLPPNNSLDADQWIDAIPFNETRKYVKAVLEHKIIFSALLEQASPRLSYLMPPINPN